MKRGLKGAGLVAAGVAALTAGGEFNWFFPALEPLSLPVFDKSGGSNVSARNALTYGGLASTAFGLYLIFSKGKK